MKYLFVTVKKVGKQIPVIEDYSFYLQKLWSSFKFTVNNICKNVYETDSYGRLHLHMILHVDDLFDWNMLKLFKRNWHVYTIEIHSHEDLQLISGYMDKEDGFKQWLDQLRNGDYKFI